ncbi:MAG: hypothetical protein P1U89_12180 [Verrucomicrobiales bacterium]|nr:hypothetical protein [Verrucomicrobiales bacterium]
MRFLDETGNDIIPRKDKVWSKAALAARMIDALEAGNRPVPDYLRAL